TAYCAATRSSAGRRSRATRPASARAFAVRRVLARVMAAAYGPEAACLATCAVRRQTVVERRRTGVTGRHEPIAHRPALRRPAGGRGAGGLPGGHADRTGE